MSQKPAKKGKPAGKRALSKKAPANSSKHATASKPITVVSSEKRWYQRAPRVKRTVRIISIWQLTKQTSLLLWQHKGVFIGIAIVYGLLNIVLAQGLGGSDVSNLKSQLSQVFTGNFGAVTSSLVVFASLIGSAGTSSDGTSAAYQLFLTLIASLAIIWALRQANAGISFRIRDAYYRGMYPLVPFVLVLLVVGLQLLPLAIGSSIYSVVMTQGIAVNGLEQTLWALIFAALALVSLYMLASSLFALYIVTLPDMTPMKALRSARELVRSRRWTVIRKVLFLLPSLLLIGAIVMVPFILFLTAAATLVFFLLTTFSLVAVHGYMYSLYRELLRE